MNIFWADTETTGRDHLKNSIIEIAGIVEIDGVEKERICHLCRPDEDISDVDGIALEVNGFSLLQIYTHPDPRLAVEHIVDILWPYVEDSQEQFIIAGKNSYFDLLFIQSMFDRVDMSLVFEHLFSHRILDISSLLIACHRQGWLNRSKSLSLSDSAAALGVECHPHRAMNDVMAARAVYDAIVGRITFGGVVNG